MRAKLVAIVLTAACAAGCSRGETPTPVPSNTPVPSAADTAPQATETPSTTDGSAPNEHPTTTESASPAETRQPAEPPQSSADDEAKATPKPPDSDAEINALSQLDAQELVDHLSDAQQRDITTRALVAKGSAAVEPLMTALGSDNWEIRAAAVFTLGQLGDDARPALSKLKEVAESDDVPAVRDVATFAIDAIQK